MLKKGFLKARFDWVRECLAKIQDTPLLNEHRVFFAKGSPQADPMKSLRVVPQAVRPTIGTNESKFKWFKNSALPALKKLLLDEMYAAETRLLLSDLLSQTDQYILQTVPEPTQEKPDKITVKKVQLSPVAQEYQKMILIDESNFEVIDD